jgi:hypothetical protein
MKNAFIILWLICATVHCLLWPMTKHLVPGMLISQSLVTHDWTCSRNGTVVLLEFNLQLVALRCVAVTCYAHSSKKRYQQGLPKMLFDVQGQIQVGRPQILILYTLILTLNMFLVFLQCVAYVSGVRVSRFLELWPCEPTSDSLSRSCTRFELKNIPETLKTVTEVTHFSNFTEDALQIHMQRTVE